MAFTSDFMCTSFKKELLQGLHDFTLTTGDVFNMALYDNNASFTAATTSYTASDEVVGTGYVAGGQALTNVTPTTTGTTAFTDFADEVWSSASFTAYGALIYNTTSTVSSPSVATVVVLDFGGAQTATNGDFTVQFPAADSTNAIIRIA